MTETTTEQTVQTIAREAYGYFETARRATGDTATGPREDGERYVRVKDAAPQWVTDLAHEAHGDFLPDDWRYQTIQAALEAIADSDDPEDDAGEFADGRTDTYTGELLAWLGSNLTRIGYVDEARRELGDGPRDGSITDEIARGQYAEAEEVYFQVLAFLNERAGA